MRQQIKNNNQRQTSWGKKWFMEMEIYMLWKTEGTENCVNHGNGMRASSRVVERSN